MSAQSITLESEELTKVNFNERTPWTLEGLEHSSGYIGSYASTIELQDQKAKGTSRFWKPRGLRGTDTKRQPKDIMEYIAHLQREIVAGKLPEHDASWDEKLLENLKKAGGGIRNILAIDLGSLSYSDDKDFRDSARAHQFVRRVFKTLDKDELAYVRQKYGVSLILPIISWHTMLTEVCSF
jgi:hypothetical protein